MNNIGRQVYQKDTSTAPRETERLGGFFILDHYVKKVIKICAAYQVFYTQMYI